MCNPIILGDQLGLDQPVNRISQFCISFLACNSLPKSKALDRVVDVLSQLGRNVAKYRLQVKCGHSSGVFAEISNVALNQTPMHAVYVLHTPQETQIGRQTSVYRIRHAARIK